MNSNTYAPVFLLRLPVIHEQTKPVAWTGAGIGRRLTGAGSQGQWFTDLVNYIQSSYGSGSAGVPVSNLNWTYWALNGVDSFGLLDSSYNGVASPAKEDSYLCFVQVGPVALPKGGNSGTCGSTGPLSAPQ